MGDVHRLTDKQIKKVSKLIDDVRARYIEMPDAMELDKARFEGTDPIVKVLQGDGQTIGHITLKQAFSI